jgi:hypothetical protein
MLNESDFFPRTTYFHPTEACKRAWRRNLARAPRRHTTWGILSANHGFSITAWLMSGVDDQLLNWFVFGLSAGYITWLHFAS